MDLSSYKFDFYGTALPTLISPVARVSRVGQQRYRCPTFWLSDEVTAASNSMVVATFNLDLQLAFDFRQFLPGSVFPRLMVKLHDYIDGPHYWRNGMLLAKPTVFKAQAWLRWDKEERKIWVSVGSEERRRFLSFIRATVQEIVADFANKAYEEVVPIPDCAEFVEYDYLVEAEKAGEQELFIKALKKKLKIAGFLDGVEEPSHRDADLQIPVNAFVSYAHHDFLIPKLCLGMPTFKLCLSG